MIRAQPATLALALASVVATGAPAQQPPPAPVRDVAGLECPPAPPEGEREILGLWQERGAALRAGNEAEAERVVAAIDDERRKRQLGPLPGLAAALLLESERSLEQGNVGKARDAARWASALDPTSAKARFQWARATFRGQGGRLAGVGIWLSGVSAAFGGFWGGYALLVNAAVVLALATVVAAAVFSLTLLARHGSAFVHEFVERLPPRWSEGSRRLVGRAVLFLPLVTFLGGAWVFLWFPAVLARHASRAERAVAGALLVLLLASGPALVRFDGLLAATVSPTAHLLADGDQRSSSRLALGEMRRMVETEPDVAAYHFLLADLYAAQIHGARTTATDEACFLLAETEYQESIRLGPEEPRFRVNLGNLYLRNGSFREAWRRYQEALTIDPDNVLAAYNLAAAYGEDVNRLQDKETMIARARAMDEQALARLMERGGGTAVIDARLSFGEMGRRILREAHGEGDDGEARPAAAAVSTLSIAGGAALGLGLLAFLAFGGRTARRCSRCGRAFCHRCNPDREASGYCAQCLHLFLRRDGVAPDARERKTREIDRFERRRRIGALVLGLVLPGAGRMVSGRTLSGFLALILWSGGLLWLVLNRRLLVLPDASFPHAGSGAGALVAAFLLLLWVATNLPRRLRAPRGRV